MGWKSRRGSVQSNVITKTTHYDTALGGFITEVLQDTGGGCSGGQEDRRTDGKEHRGQEDGKEEIIEDRREMNPCLR